MRQSLGDCRGRVEKPRNSLARYRFSEGGVRIGLCQHPHPPRRRRTGIGDYVFRPLSEPTILLYRTRPRKSSLTATNCASRPCYRCADVNLRDRYHGPALRPTDVCSKIGGEALLLALNYTSRNANVLTPPPPPYVKLLPVSLELQIGVFVLAGSRVL